MPWNPNEEDEALRWSWERHDAAYLDGYMIADVEDPRIHCQSIITRALVADTVWPDEFTELINAEQRFGLVMTWLLRQFKSGSTPEDIQDQILAGDCPAFIAETQAWLSQQEGIADYITLTLENHCAELPEMALDSFADLWRDQLATRPVDRPLRLLEAACGSANDYRFLDSFGFSRFIDYAGFDISPKNIANARRRFPGTNFVVASAFDTGLADGAYDFVFTHDLFEHLSPDGIGRALDELVRITGRQAWLHFFNLSVTATDHKIVPVENYHWNLLSLGQLQKILPADVGDVQTIEIAEFLNNQFGYPDYYNREAVTLLVTRDR